MNTKYRVFHETEVFTGDDGSVVTDIRPYDLRDRTKASAIELARTLKNGNVRPKGSSKITWSVFDLEPRRKPTWAEVAAA